jgi:YidC/Oxa1 family membrane protein insertase
LSELSPERRALLAFVLSIIILVVWSRFYKPPAPAPQPPPAPSQQVSHPGEAAAPAAQSPASSVTVPAPVAAAGAKAAAKEETFVVESPLYRVEFSNRGGVVQSWQLKKYFDDQKPPHVLDLVNAQTAKQFGGWPFSIVLDDPQLQNMANSALYQVKPSLKSVQAPAEITFEWSDGRLAVSKHLKFLSSYLFDLDVSVTLEGKPLPASVAWRGGFGDVTAYKAAQTLNVFYSTSGKLNVLAYKKLGVSGHSEQRMEQPGTMEYVGIEDQFFTAAFLSNGSGLNLWHWTEQRDVIEGDKPDKEPVAEMAASTPTPGPLSARVYVGPKELARLEALQPPLEDLVQFGWTGIIAKPLFEVLKWIYRYVPNYGWAIVLLTLAINLALFPLKMKSWRSMQRMQKVAPEVESIKQKYQKYSMTDPRKKKMNEEMMAIYQREGINPMGGCLPMLLQMPIWWALYRMLQGAIELRHAPWIGWIHDLSAHDPYYILPILMTVTMYLMQKMTPVTTVDPTQQKMMTLMPLMFGIFFFTLSSGLVLYIFTSNLVGMGQQWYLNRTAPLPAKGKGPKANGKNT